VFPTRKLSTGWTVPHKFVSFRAYILWPDALPNAKPTYFWNNEGSVSKFTYKLYIQDKTNLLLRADSASVLRNKNTTNTKQDNHNQNFATFLNGRDVHETLKSRDWDETRQLKTQVKTRRYSKSDETRRDRDNWWHRSRRDETFIRKSCDRDI